MKQLYTAHLRADCVLNAIIVFDALGVTLPQQSGEPEGVYSQEMTGAQISSDEDTPV